MRVGKAGQDRTGPVVRKDGRGDKWPVAAKVNALTGAGAGGTRCTAWACRQTAPEAARMRSSFLPCAELLLAAMAGV